MSKQKKIDLSGLKFAVLALGDRQYSQFGYNLNEWLIAQSAKPLFDMLRVDQLNVEDLSAWNKQLNLATFEKQQRPWSSLALHERELLNKGSQGNPLYRLIFNSPKDMVWNSGDILEVQCANVSEKIQHFLIRHPIHIE